MRDKKQKSTSAVLSSSPSPKKTASEKGRNADKTSTGRAGRRKNPSSRKTGKILAGILLALLVILYGSGVYYYSGHFHHNTYVNGAKLSEMTVAEAENVFTQDFSSHEITIKEKERTESIDPEEVGAVIKVGSQITDLRKSLNPWTWFTDLFGKENYTVFLDVTYEEAALEAAVDRLLCFSKENVTAPADAYIQAGETQFEIVPEVLGNTVKKSKLIELIGTDLATGVTSIDLEKEDLYKLPTVYATDTAITAALEKANTYTAGTVTYDFKYTTEPLGYATTKDWISISKNFKVTLEEEKVSDYVSDLGAKYNTMGSSRTFKTSNGSTINAYGGDYGWKIYHDEETKKLLTDLKSGKDVTREPVYSYKALCRNSAKDDIGDSYVEVSISSQELWLYVDGECVLDSSIVTGNPTTGHETYTGIYSITYKQSPATLTGPNSNGSRYSSKVTYWMPFNGGQGLHDATWRDSFGGSIYKSNGSHGCVNCPYSTAETLYKYVDEGFPVVIY